MESLRTASEEETGVARGQLRQETGSSGLGGLTGWVHWKHEAKIVELVEEIQLAKAAGEEL